MKKLAIIVIALFSAAAFAQDLPKIAVYVTGDVPDNEKKTLGTRMLASLVNSGRYVGIERSNAFLAEIEKEHVKQRSGDIDDSQISALGKQFGVKFVCIADITKVLGAFQVSARIVDVETAEVAFIGESYSALKNVIDLIAVCDQVVKNMFGGKPTPKSSTGRTAAEPEKPTPGQKPVYTAAKPEEPKPSDIPTTVVSKNYDSYFTWRYLPIASPVYLGLPAPNVETGWVWKNGMFWGFDFGLALDMFRDTLNWVGTVGLGLNIGKSFELAHDLNLALGGSLGIWGWFDYDYDEEGFNWIGPFVQLRYRMFELSYRGLFGTEGYDGFGISNQVGIGLHFEGSERFGQPRNYESYVAFRYLPIASPVVYVSPIAYNIEGGLVLENGVFMGIDLGVAIGIDGNKGHIGGGCNLGKSFELAHDFNLVLGGSLGVWVWIEDEYNIKPGSYYEYDNLPWHYSKIGISGIGPFVRLRYGIFELSYRALFGEERYSRSRGLGPSAPSPPGTSVIEPTSELLSSGFGVSNQLGIGLYIESKTRHR